MAGHAKGASEARPQEQDRRRTILRAAVEVFAKKGYHGCRIADVAKEAGVAYGLVYHYFQNKEELLQSVFETAWGGFVSRIRDVAEAPAPLDAQVRGICDVAFEAYHVDPRGVRVLILEIARSTEGGKVNRLTAYAELIRLAEEMFIRARARGELRDGLDPRLCAALMFGGVEMGLTAFVSGLMRDDDPAALERAKQQLADSLLRGFLSDAAAEAASRRPVTPRLRAAKRT